LGTEVDGDDLHIRPTERYVVEEDIGGKIPSVKSQLWPGFPSDMTSMATAFATQCQGTVLIHEWMFEARMFWVGSLELMGARLVLCDPHRVVVVGPSQLYGSEIRSPDIRAGLALLGAALAAKGTSVINNIDQIDRGYEAIDGRRASRWRYRELLPLEEAENAVSLGEGNTPLYELPVLGSRLGMHRLMVKDEGLLPTGTFKARGAAVGVSRAGELGVSTIAL